MIEAKDLIDISVTWCPGETLIYPGDPAPEYGMIWELDKGGIANVGYLRTGIHYATHVDAPWHFTNSGKKMHEVNLDHWIGPAAVLDCTDEPVCVSSDTLRRFDLTGVERVLFKTMNSVDYYHREGFYEKFIYLDKSACEYLVRETPVKTVGIDYITVDPYMCDGFPAHHTLLENGVLIIECIDLRDVEPGEYQLLCFPLKLKNTDGAPARAFLIKR
jgi:arylformamidase